MPGGRLVKAGIKSHFSGMQHLLQFLLQVVRSLGKLLKPDGVKALVAENCLLKHQLLIANRSRRRAPNFRFSDRLLFGLGSLFLRPRRLLRTAILIKPSTLLRCHRALAQLKLKWLYCSGHRHKPGPKGPGQDLIRAIIELKRRNPHLGCRKIARQLVKRFGIELDKDVARLWDARSGHAIADPFILTRTVWNRELLWKTGTRSFKFVGDSAWMQDRATGELIPSAFFSEGLRSGAQFSPDGRRTRRPSLDGPACVWDIAPKTKMAPGWLLELAEAICGQTLTETAVMEPSFDDPAATLRRIRHYLTQQNADDDWLAWGRWFLADPPNRSISPFSRLSVAEFVEDRLKERNIYSLNEAEELALNNADWLNRIAEARVALSQELEF
jgi:hypothetical protein